MTRRILVIKRHPDILSAMSTRRGVGGSTLLSLTGGILMKLLSVSLMNQHDVFGIEVLAGYCINVMSNLVMGAGLMLGLIYFF